MYWSWIIRGWENGATLSAKGYAESVYIVLTFDPSKTLFQPKITNASSIDYIEALFSDRIIKRQKLNNGAYVDLFVNCNGVEIELSLDK